MQGAAGRDRGARPGAGAPRTGRRAALSWLRRAATAVGVRPGALPGRVLWWAYLAAATASTVHGLRHHARPAANTGAGAPCLHGRRGGTGAAGQRSRPRFPQDRRRARRADRHGAGWIRRAKGRAEWLRVQGTSRRTSSTRCCPPPSPPARRWLTRCRRSDWPRRLSDACSARSRRPGTSSPCSPAVGFSPRNAAAEFPLDWRSHADTPATA